MGLAQVQSALARLFTDAELRARFLSDPDSTAEQLGLSVEEIAQLREIARDEIAAFARSLKQKRLGAVRELLPLTARALGARFEVLFLEHAAHYRPAGIRKHLDDALAFALFLAERRPPLDPPWLACLVGYEATSLELRNSDRAFRIRFLRYHPAQMIARCGEEDREPGIAPRPCLAIWFRTSRRHSFRHWVLPSGR